MSKTRVRDFLLYVGIGILVAIAAIAYGIYSAKTGRKPIFKNDWTVAVVSAAIGFGSGLRSFWQLRRNLAFWAAWSGLLFAHFVILIPLLSRMEKVPLFFVVGLVPLDVFHYSVRGEQARVG
jgi:hypothetical protein